MTAKTTVHHDPSDSRARLPNWIAVLLIAVSMIFIGSALTGPAHAQGEHGEIPSITLDSNQPGQLVITWETPDPAPTDYRIRWARADLNFLSWNGTNEAERANEEPDGAATTRTLNNLTPGENYKVQMRARYYNADRSVHKSSGPWTNVITQRVMNHPPAAPTGLAASQVSHDSLTLTWDDPQDANITGYRVMRGPDAGSLSTLANTQSDSTSFADSTVEPETTYHYGVLALSQDGDGAQSTTSVTTPAEPQPDPPAAPTGLTASNVQHDSLTLNWDDPEDDSITGYRVLRGPDADNLSTIEEDTEGTSTEYEDETVSPETTYFYAVLALSQDRNSVQSGAISATTPAAPSSGEQNEPREAPKKKDPPQRVGPRQAVTTDVWTATLTPADFGSGNLGCNNASAIATQKCSTATVLSDDDFTYDSTNYSLTILYLTATAFSLTVDADITAATNDLTIVVGSTSLAFADANTQTTRVRTWFNPGFSWTAGTDVSIRITDLAPPSLTSAVVLADGNTIQLAFSEDLQSANLPPAAAFTVTAGGSAVTVTGVAAESTADVLQITVSPLIGQGQSVVVAYEDPTAVDDANAIQDAAGNDTPDFTTGSGSVPAVTNNSALINEVLASWSLTPAGLAVGDQFRLIFLSSTKRNALSTDIADYNTFVQDRAAAGHTDIHAYSGGFGVIGCTAAVDARDNTATTGTTGTGVPIYWLDGTKVADDYADFYDGSWDDEIADKNESGTDAHDTSQEANYPFTGCKNDGTEESAGAHNPRSLGSTNGNVRIGRLNSSGTLQDPIDGNGNADTTATRPMYGLSAVFEVSSSPSTNPSVPAAISDVAVVPEPRTTNSLRVSWTAPDNTGKPALTGYELRYKGTASDAEWVVVSHVGTGTSGTLTGLDQDKNYFVEVRALNAEYSGPWSVTTEAATTPVPETVLANHPLVPDDLGPGDSFRLLYVTSVTTAATGTGIHDYDDLVTIDVLRIVDGSNLLARWFEGSLLSQRALVSTAGADARLHTDTTWNGTDRGVPIYWVNGARVADDYEDFYDGSWDDEANPMNGFGKPRSLAGTAPWIGSGHDGTELFEGGMSRAVGQSMVGVGALDSSGPPDGPLNGSATFASTEGRPLYALWHVMIIDEDYRLAYNVHAAHDTTIKSDEREAVRAQPFTTGSHPGSYGITEIKVRKGSGDEDGFLGDVALYTTDTTGDPDLVDGLHATFSLQGGRSTLADWYLTAPEGTVLEASTTYALVFQGRGGSYPKLSTSSADGEDTVVEGWSIGDVLRYHDGSNWIDNPDGYALSMDIIGPLADVATDVWTATFTPADLTGGFIGCDDDTLTTAFECSTATVLSDNDFTYDSTDYSVIALFLNSGGNLAFKLDTDITTATNDLTLVIGTSSFAFANADTATNTARIWNSTSLSWTAGTPVAVKLIETNTPAAGAPTVTAPNVFRIPAVLSVDLSGITDTDGVTGIATTATYKWQRFNAAGTTLETDSIGTDATYTLTDTDATKTLKVVVNFTDDASNSEGPLTSAATSAITAAASCPTPTYVGGATQVWTAKVGVGKNSDFYGYYDDTTLDFGSLDQTRFSISSNNYRMDRVFTQPGPSLAFSMKSDFTSDEQKTLTLHICDQAFAFSVAGAPSGGSTYAFLESAFPGADLDWSTHAERTIYLSQDTAAPTFTTATVNGSTLVVTLSEDLGAAGSLVNAPFTVKKGTSGTTQTLSGTPSISGSTVTLTLATAVTASDTAVKVAYTKPTSGSANKLIDEFGNETATFPDQDVTIDTTDNTPPTLTSATVPATGTALNLRFSENIKASALPTLSTFTITADGIALGLSTVGVPGGEFDVIRVVFSPAIRQGQAVVVTYTDPTGGNDANAIQDAAGNDVETFTTGTNSVPGVTNNSTVTPIAPGAPTNLTATASGSIGSTQIDLSWTAPADNGGRVITGYKIEVSSDAGNAWTDRVATTGDNNTTYAHTGLPDGTTLHYRVSAINTVGTSTASNVDSATTAGTASVPRVPVSNTGQTGNSDTVISAAEQAQAFTTGATSSTVTSVTIRSEDSEGDDIALKICETTGSSIPTTTCTDLTAPGTYPAGLLVFTAPNLALNATTTYSVVFSSPDGDSVTLDATDSDNEDASSLGWTIRNKSQVKNPNWADRGFDRAIIIAINGRTPNALATGTPTISGTAQVSRTLTASTSGISDPNGLPSTFNYQWKRYSSDGNTFESNIGVNSRTYTLTGAEEGKKVRVEVRFNDNDNNSEGPLLSAAYPGTGTVRAAPMPLQRTQQEDRRYTFTESDFSNLPGGIVQLSTLIITELPNSGWLARSKTVLLPSGNRQGQSDRIYSRHLPLTFSLEDTRRLRLAFSPEANENGTPYTSFKFKVNSRSEEHTMLINITPVNDPAYGKVFITGPAQVGYELTAFTSAIGDRDGIPRDQLNYQWKRYAANGTTFETNIGANSSTYRVTDNDVGKKIKLEVRFTDNDGTHEGPLTSPAFPYIATQTVGEATFISTIGMVGDSYRSFTTQEQGQVFTTGGNPNGYTVTSVVIISEDSAGDDVALKICGVDESLHPTAVCTDLTAPGSSPAGPLVFTAPPGTTLAGGRTNYMVVFSSPGEDNVRLDTHYSDGYDSNSLAGFSIRNRIHYKTGTGWQEISYRRGFRIAVLGTINP